MCFDANVSEFPLISASGAPHVNLGRGVRVPGHFRRSIFPSSGMPLDYLIYGDINSIFGNNSPWKTRGPRWRTLDYALRHRQGRLHSPTPSS